MKSSQYEVSVYFGTKKIETCFCVCSGWANVIGIKWAPSWTRRNTSMICSHRGCVRVKLKEKLCDIKLYVTWPWHKADIYEWDKGNESPVRILASSSCVWRCLCGIYSVTLYSHQSSTLADILDFSPTWPVNDPVPRSPLTTHPLVGEWLVH